ncbi:MAG: UDP-N-acetylmuramoyl-tripeptide--D-alanyl-D-alanine ligase [Verrucomicrobia subdivision 3 bacterium]|nr:UDP-N-acetylmuramoyl-tripeptide--D-alanyl-D-alanine ligase [Limisphaerales bacterium]
MEPRSLEFVAQACAGELIGGGPDILVMRVSTDSRKICAGDLFVAIKGERFDGHEYIREVAAKGAAAAVVERGRVFRSALPAIAVADTRKALGLLAARYRKDFQIRVIAVGGSNGKTTTKELIAAVLRQRYEIAWSEASFNNDIGVPLTLLSIESKHEAAVVEVGTNHPGELPALVKIVQPNLGVITNIGREHLEHFGSIEGVMEEEGWLAELLPASGTLFLNGESPWTDKIRRRGGAKCVTVGVNRSAHWRGEFISMNDSGVRFRVSGPQPEFDGDYEIGLLGRHQIANALFAVAVGAELGVDPGEARAGLAAAKPAKMRMQLFEVRGVRVLDDTYNANADSTLAALQVLADLPCHGRRIAVLGDMAELGPHTVEAHREVGCRAVELGVNQLIAVGDFGPVTVEAAVASGLQNAFAYRDVASAANEIPSLLRGGDLVLLKASRSAGLERVGERLRTEV